MLFIQRKRILESVTFWIVSMFSQNTTNTTGSFQEASFFHMLHLFFIFKKLCCSCHYFLDLCPPTAKELGVLCELFWFYHELAVPKKSQDDDDKAFNSYDFCLYGLCCAVEQDIEKAQHLKLAIERYLHATLFHCIFFIFLLIMLMMIASKYQELSKSPKFCSRKLIIPTKLCQPTKGFVIVVIVSYFLLSFWTECLFCHIYLRALHVEKTTRKPQKERKIWVQIMWSITIMNWFKRKWSTIWRCFTKQVYQVISLWYFRLELFHCFLKSRIWHYVPFVFLSIMFHQVLGVW